MSDLRALLTLLAVCAAFVIAIPPALLLGVWWFGKCVEWFEAMGMLR